MGREPYHADPPPVELAGYFRSSLRDEICDTLKRYATFHL
jgi:hypothetical protein